LEDGLSELKQEEYIFLSCLDKSRNMLNGVERSWISEKRMFIIFRD